MKKKFLSLFLILFVTIVCTTNVNAWQTGDYTGGGGSTGGGTDINSMTDGGSGFDSGVYLFQLVYKPKNGNYSQVTKNSCVVVNAGIPSGKFPISDIDRKAKSTADKNGCRYLNASNRGNESLYRLALDIKRLNGLDNVKLVDEKDYAKNLVSEFGLNYSKLTKAGSKPGNINSYGYRILVQKLTCFGYGPAGSATPTWCSILYPRKSWASEKPNLGLFGGSFQGDLYTTQDDIGIKKAAITSWYSTTGNGSQLGKNFADKNKGEGYNIIGFIPDVFVPPYKPYNFQIDAACQRCDSTDTENKALIVQDTPDWDKILETKIYPSTNDKYGTVKSYFDKGNGIVCREEIYVNFPNQNNIIAVEPGRYFIVNPSNDEWKKVISSGIPNFRPVKVTKIRQCKGADAGKLNSYAGNAANKFKKEMGTVWFKYNENYSGSKYNNDGYQKMRGYDQTYSSNVSGDMLTMKTSMSYTLPEDYYQYIYKANGLSIKKATVEQKNSGHYINVGVPNLPVSINNTSADAAKVQFAYDLPENDGHELGTAYTEQNTYLKLGDTKNIYEEGKESNLRNSACAKMYGYNSGLLYSECVKHRKSNAVGLRGSDTGFSSCFGKLDKEADGSKPEGYICVLQNSKPELECDITNHKDFGLDWNPKANKCCDSGQVYNPSTGKCVSDDNPPGTPPGDKCRTQEDAIRLNRSWNPTAKICCEKGTVYNPYIKVCAPNNNPPGDNEECKIENGKYYDRKGNEITKSEYEQVCCPTPCEYGCCPSGECAPMPKVNGHVVCPSPGGLNIIYRPVDLKYTFPGQAGTDAGKSRDTGSNWCEYDIKTKKLINCNSNNNVVKYYVNNKNTEVYSGDPLYEVKLDSKTISSIREYNRKQKAQGGYDDFTLKCDSSGKRCISQFLRSKTSASVTLENSSLCKSTNKSDFDKCDDSKKGSR